MKNYSIRPIKASETHLLRQKILRPHQSLEEMDYPGDKDKETIHYGLFIDNILSGIASVYFESMPGNNDNNSYRLRGMAIDENLRSEGYGKILLDKLITDLKEKNVNVFWCNARTPAAGFYKNLGFEVIGNEFEIKGIGPHYLMQLDL